MSGRPATDAEVAVVRWLLKEAAVGPSPHDVDLASARVVSGCDCGCTSFDFLPLESDAAPKPVASAVAEWPDGTAAGVILWASEQRVHGVEVHDLDEGTSRRNVSADLLRVWPTPA